MGGVINIFCFRLFVYNNRIAVFNTHAPERANMLCGVELAELIVVLDFGVIPVDFIDVIDATTFFDTGNLLEELDFGASFFVGFVVIEHRRDALDCQVDNADVAVRILLGALFVCCDCFRSGASHDCDGD